MDIPSDDMKGRVIGREGRNIRAFEKATGVDVIVDDTPGVVVVCGFDPVRREVARLSLEKLIQDGRIHPTRIEEVVAGTEQGGRASRSASCGKEAVHRGQRPRPARQARRTCWAGCTSAPATARTCCSTRIEVAYLSPGDGRRAGPRRRRWPAAAACCTTSARPSTTRSRAATRRSAPTCCKRYGERDEVVNAVAGHHGDVAAEQPVHADRRGRRRHQRHRGPAPAARRSNATSSGWRSSRRSPTSFEGVEQAYAIQAGREVRVIVDAENVDDRLAAKIARDIAKRIEDELTYPGEIKVTLIREVRCVEYAR